MLIDAVDARCVSEMSNEKQEKILQEHFRLLYLILAQSLLVPNARFERVGNIFRCFSGIENPFHNGVIGFPEKDWDSCIDEQIEYFKNLNMPFVWYVDEKSSPECKQVLLDHGFIDGAVFQGVIGPLDLQSSPLDLESSPHEISDDFSFFLVEDESSLEQFNSLVCDTFQIHGVSREMFKKVLHDASLAVDHPMFHWAAKKEGRVISVVSTLINGAEVSFWNGATVPEYRRQGLSTKLRTLALQHARKRGCTVGMSYLMSDAMAFGICSKLGYKTKWRFNVFIAP